MMDNKKRAARAVEILKTVYPDAACALEWGGEEGWKLLIMGRLSAQCTDARVNIVCEELFKRFPDAYAMANGDLSEIEEIVKPCGLYRMKADNIREASRMLITDFDGVLPDSMDELLKLPGVGRKIANLLLGDVFKKEAIVCDTHCIRICGRLGMYPEKEKDPTKIEGILRGLIDMKEGSDFCHRIVLFGRETCTARSPKCNECPLADLCCKREKENGKN
jgi:endonuclease-3